MAAGYSGTPLAKKLGIVEGTRIFLLDAPNNYLELAAPVPERAQVVKKMDDRTDIVHLFTTKRARLTALLRSSLAKLRPDAAIWVSWPKKASKIPTDITEDTIRQVALPMGLVDIKVCAINEVWSGLKLVVRKENRK
jgi:hypothetical protein